jgi:hypothetical protein
MRRRYWAVSRVPVAGVRLTEEAVRRADGVYLAGRHSWNGMTEVTDRSGRLRRSTRPDHRPNDHFVIAVTVTARCLLPTYGGFVSFSPMEGQQTK